MDYTTPKTFDEYIERFPDHHRQWLARRYPQLLYTPDFEDACQHLLLETLRRKRVEQYDHTKRSKRGQKDTPSLFLSFLSHCFNRDIIMLWDRRQKHKRLANERTSSLDDFISLKSNGSNEGSTDHEAIGLASQDYAHRAEHEGEKIVVAAQLAEFRAFVGKHRPELLRALDDVHAATGEQRRRLGDLAWCMAEGIVPKKPRKPYTRRKPKPAPKPSGDMRRFNHPKLKYVFTKEQIASCIERRLRVRVAARELRCSAPVMRKWARHYFGKDWGELVGSTNNRVKKAKA